MDEKNVVVNKNEVIIYVKPNGCKVKVINMTNPLDEKIHIITENMDNIKEDGYYEYKCKSDDIIQVESHEFMGIKPIFPNGFITTGLPCNSMDVFAEQKNLYFLDKSQECNFPCYRFKVPKENVIVDALTDRKHMRLYFQTDINGIYVEYFERRQKTKEYLYTDHSVNFTTYYLYKHNVKKFIFQIYLPSCHNILLNRVIIDRPDGKEIFEINDLYFKDDKYIPMYRIGEMENKLCSYIYPVHSEINKNVSYRISIPYFENVYISIETISTSVVKFNKISESIVFTKISDGMKTYPYPNYLNKNDSLVLLVNNKEIKNKELKVRFALLDDEISNKYLISKLNIVSDDNVIDTYEFDRVDPETDLEKNLNKEIYCLNLNVLKNTEYDINVILKEKEREVFKSIIHERTSNNMLCFPDCSKENNICFSCYNDTVSVGYVSDKLINSFVVLVFNANSNCEPISVLDIFVLNKYKKSFKYKMPKNNVVIEIFDDYSNYFVNSIILKNHLIKLLYSINIKNCSFNTIESEELFSFEQNKIVNLTFKGELHFCESILITTPYGYKSKYDNLKTNINVILVKDLSTKVEIILNKDRVCHFIDIYDSKYSFIYEELYKECCDIIYPETDDNKQHILIMFKPLIESAVIEIETQLRKEIIEMDTNKIETNNNEGSIIDYFEIPEDLAKELSDNLIKQTIRQRTLTEVVNDPDRYTNAENLLIPIVQRIEVIKNKITKEYVPEKYRSSEYMWNYDGFEIDENRVQILKV